MTITRISASATQNVVGESLCHLAWHLGDQLGRQVRGLARIRLGRLHRRRRGLLQQLIG